MDLFNQGMRVTLINALKRILDQYPNNGQILKEIIQNAEDAGARHVKFLLDETHYGEESGVSPDDPAYPYLGPALCVYNDASLTDKDWKGISDIEGSIKANDPTTIGRFGLGFKSVFHLTDVPSIYSGDNIGFMDPHEQLFQKEGYRVPVYGCCLLENILDCPGKTLFQKVPYQHKIFNSQSLRKYPHTIFRFPLRAQRSSSKLSTDGCPVKDILELLETIAQESYMNLLFLKNIEKIEVYRKKSSKEEPNRHFSVELCGGENLTETRSGRGRTKEMMKSDWKRFSRHTSYKMCIKETNMFKQSRTCVRECEWLICNMMDAGQNKSEMIHLAEHLHLLPAVGVAIPLMAQKSDLGHLFCCLPLPLEGKSPTGLPIHINGHFVLDQTRHHVKWSTRDLESTKSREVKWNLALVTQVLPKAYVHLLLQIKSLIQDEEDTDMLHSCLMNSLPSKCTTDPKWQPLVSELYKLYCQEELLYTESGDGRWIRPDEAWYLDTNMIQSERELLHQLLCHLKEPVVKVQQHVFDRINENITTSTVSPAMTRKVLKRKSMPSCITRENKLEILKYILIDLQFHDLGQIELLPVSTGEFIAFTTGNVGEKVYMASQDHPQNLLPGMEKHFLDTIRDRELLETLQKLASSDHTQLRTFGADDFISNVRSVSCHYRNQFWFDRIWRYISSQFPHSLSKLEGLQILPVELSSGANEHLKLDLHKPWLLCKYSKDACDKMVQNVLEVLGAKLIKSVSCDSALNHSQLLGNFIHEYNLRGVMTCLDNLSVGTKHNQIMQDFLSKTTVDEKMAFQGYCSRISTAVGLNDLGKTLLRKLALFKMQGSDSTFTSFAQTAYGCKEKRIVHKEAVIDSSTDQARILGEAFGMHLIDTTELIIRHILPSVQQGRYTENEITNIMIYILDNHLIKHEAIRRQLEKLQFVITQSGVKEVPSNLFDPTDSFVSSFCKGDIVPCDDYMKYIGQLRTLGVKTADNVTPKDLLTFAKGIDSDLNTARKFMQLLSHKSELLQESVNGQELGFLLKPTKWVPIKQKAPDGYPKGLHWYGNTVKLANPEDVLSEDHQFLIGAFIPIPESSSDTLACYYNWKRQPDFSTVKKQLEQVYLLSKQSSPLSYAVTSITQKIYCHIQLLLYKTSFSAACKEIKNMIWNGTRFISAERILPNPPIPNMEPYIYKLPKELGSFKTLLIKCGMLEECNLIDILHKIRDHHKKPHHRNQVESERDRNLAILILEKLSKQGLDTDMLDSIPVPVWTHDNTLRMSEIKDCAYDERIWKAGFSSEGDDIEFVHPSMPLILVEALKVRTLTSQVLDVTELDFEEFGQSEPLTRRLQNILEEYPDGFSVPKELIQNADDAGATEVSFVFDERNHRQFVSKLFDSNMEKCQGPALLVYNDAMFTEKDFENIIKLGGRTKETQMDKVGRFGLGFNSVYHLTDVPTFISGKYLVMLDPHISHLSKCIRDMRNPGIRVNVGRKKAVEQFSDQYQPYEGIHGCSILQASEDGYCYPATLFRFPLRTVQQAEESQICDQPYDQHEVKKMFKLFIESIDTCLLFTQNVKKITIHILPKNGKSFEDKELLCQVEKRYKPIGTNVNFPENAFNQKNILKVASDLAKANSADEITSAMVAEMHCTFTCFTRKYLHIDREKYAVKNWLVCQVISGQIMIKSTDLKGAAPVGGIAVQLLEKGDKFFPTPIDNGRLFCFLPLPQRSELPVHINGCFALSSNRRHIIEPCPDDKNSAGLWNNLLLSEPISRAYVKALALLADISGMNTFDIWPYSRAGSNNQKCVLAKCVLQKIAEENEFCIFTDGQKKSTISGISFLKQGNFSFERNSESVSCEHIARNVLCSAMSPRDIIVVDIPRFIQESFEDAGVKDAVNRRMYTRERFMEEVFLPEINNIDRSVRDEIMQMVILDSDKIVDSMVRTKRCIPVSPNGDVLKVPNELLYPEGEAAEMYTNVDGRFPFPGINSVMQNKLSYCTADMLRGLERIGMPRDELTPNDICERATSVARLPYDEGKERSRKIIHYLPRMSRHFSDLPLSKLKDTSFLPVMKKPDTYPLPWHVREAKYCTPKETYTSENKHLLGSVIPIVDNELFTRREEVRELLGLRDLFPPLCLIIAQMNMILSCNPSTISNHIQFREFQKCIYVVFKALERQLCKGEQHDTSAYVLNRLKGNPCILVGKIFVCPSSCAIKFGGKCEPWMCEIPSEISRHCVKLLRLLDVPERFKIEDFIRILQQKHESYSGNALDSAELETAVVVVQKLTKLIHDEKIDAKDIKKRHGIIYIPDDNAILCPSHKLCLRDADFEAEPDSRFAHPDLSIKAESILCGLGVKTSKEHTLCKRTSGIPFGQSEKLQNRIRRILDGYPCDTTLLKELLQNADDAGATELHFILDPVSHPSEKVFHESWKPLQGPALCVYNNKPFTKADIEGIKNLGEGSKSEDPAKTGQYGVGFNCVYHITDTPTFITFVDGEEKVLIAFDPTCHYIPGATVQEPGKMYTDLEFLEGRFPDVFKPFMLDRFPERNSTMFRLPLRTLSENSNKNLLDKNVTVDQISDLLKTFQDEAGDCLLFLKTVSKVIFSHVDAVTGRIVEDYWVKCTMSYDQTRDKDNFVHITKHLAKRLKDKTCKVSQSDHHTVSYVTERRDSKGRLEEWAITQAVGFTRGEELPKPLAEAHHQGDIALLPLGGVAGLLKVNGKHKNIKPTVNKEERYLYCSLPLPVQCNMPVHINGHFALDHESRRSLWVGEDSVKYQWNRALMRNVIVPAYIAFLKVLQREILQIRDTGVLTIKNERQRSVYQKRIGYFNHYFPRDDSTPYVQYFVDELYRRLHGSRTTVFPVIWSPKFGENLVMELFSLQHNIGKQAVFKMVSYSDKEIEEKQQRKQLEKTLEKCGYRFFQTPKHVQQKLKSYTCMLKNVPLSMLHNSLSVAIVRTIHVI